MGFDGTLLGHYWDLIGTLTVPRWLLPACDLKSLSNNENPGPVSTRENAHPIRPDLPPYPALPCANLCGPAVRFLFVPLYNRTCYSVYVPCNKSGTRRTGSDQPHFVGERVQPPFIRVHRFHPGFNRFFQFPRSKHRLPGLLPVLS